MATIFLPESTAGMSNPIDQSIVDYFCRNSIILSMIPFKNDISPQGGSTLAYTYQIEKKPSFASGREINSEYNANESIRGNKTTYLKIFGGAYEIDRVLAKNPAGREDEVSYQNRRKIEATINKFHNDFINGNATEDNKNIDGLKILLKDTVNEIDGSSLDLTSLTKDKALNVTTILDRAIAQLGRKPDLIITGFEGSLKLANVAKYAEYFTHSEDAFGRSTDKYDGIRFIDIGKYYDGEEDVLKEIIPVRTEDEYVRVPVIKETFTTDGTLYTESGGSYTAVSSGSFNAGTKYYKKIGKKGTTDFYFVCFGEDEVCALSPDGSPLVEAHLPDFTDAKAVHRGDVEAVWGLMMKSTKAAAVIRGVTV